MLVYCVSLLLLALLAAEDIREKKISAGIIMAFALGAVLYQMVLGCFFWREAMISLLPGCMLILVSFLTKESIGYGDGALVMTLGLWTGGRFALGVMLIGIMLSGVYGLCCLLKRRRDPIPFVPFLLLGMEVMLIYV